MKRIAFLRHGISNCDGGGKLNAKEYRKWLIQYDESGIFSPDSVPAQTKAVFEQSNVVLTSDLKRAIESLAVLGHQTNRTEQLRLLREASIPAPNFSIPFLTVKPGVWNVIMRLLLLGDYAEDYGHVFVVGHGFFNRMVGKQLESQGWDLEGKHDHTNWSCTVYIKI